MARPVGKLRAAGFERVGPENRRRYRNVRTGEEVSYRRAFREARGESLERAVRNPGKFADELRLAERVRFLAKQGLLSEAGLATKRQERELAGKSLRQLTKGHYGLPPRDEEGKFKAKARRPETRSLYAKLVLDRLNERPKVTPRPGEKGEDVEARYRKERERIDSSTGDKANLLIALGYRDPAADYDVGETP